jgi:hypothetical protein
MAGRVTINRPVSQVAWVALMERTVVLAATAAIPTALVNVQAVVAAAARQMRQVALVAPAAARALPADRVARLEATVFPEHLGRAAAAAVAAVPAARLDPALPTQSH